MAKITPICMTLIFLLLLTLPALANGYDIYASPLAWSPDSRMLAVALGSEINSATICEGELRLYDDQGHFEVLADGLVGSPCFSPCGQWLAVIVAGDVVVYDVTDSSARWITTSGDALDVSWGADSIDGGAVLNYSFGTRFYGCSTATLFWERETTVIWDKPSTLGSALGITSGPGGTYICYLWQASWDDEFVPGSATDQDYERLRVRGPGNPVDRQVAPRRLTQWDYHESNPRFIDESNVLFQRGGWGDWDLYRVDLDTGVEYLELPDAQQPSISRDGRWLGFTRRPRKAKSEEEWDWEITPQVILRDRFTGRIYPLTPDGVHAIFACVSPDGRRVAWLEATASMTPKVVIRSRLGITGSVRAHR